VELIAGVCKLLNYINSIVLILKTSKLKREWVMKLEVERMQYGVGQGCFHTQRISVGRKEEDLYKEQNQFDFVYDCGSDSANVGTVSPLKCAIEHYRPKRSVVGNATPTVDALFVSHFHFDHINGIEELCKQKNVLRVFVPFYTPEEVLTVLLDEAEQLIASSDDFILWFLTELRNLSLRIDMFGAPTIYVLPDERQEIGPIGGPEIPPFGETIFVDADVLRTKKMVSGQSLTWKLSGREIWEIKVWHFKPAINKPTDWELAIQKLEEALGDAFTEQGTVDTAVAKKVRDAASEICKGMSNASEAGDKNHNLVSMCVYSGPVPGYTIKGEVSRMNAPNNQSAEIHFSARFSAAAGSRGHFYMRDYDRSTARLEQLGWLGTGDAMLARKDVWNEFNCSMEWDNSRAELVSTILMPHHGSVSGQNYNSNLVRVHQPLAIFSAGAFSKHGHPATAVLSDVAKHGSDVVSVTEYTRLGVFELVRAGTYFP
jgi:ribonuclease BN (tRNA processing enzyme)